MLKTSIIFFLSIFSSAFLYTAPLNNSKILAALPGLKWALSINGDNFNLKKDRLKKDGNGRMLYLLNRENGIIMSVFIEKAPLKGDESTCRKYYWNKTKKSSLKKTNIKLSKFKRIALLEYIIPFYQGIKINQKNINAYLSKDGYWIDIHLSKTSFITKNLKEFLKLLKSIKIVNNYTPGLYENFLFANNFYNNSLYKKAIIYYKKILDSQKRKKTLPRTNMRVLINSLGISYGSIGKLHRSLNLFKYGISIDPVFPMYYYNMACAYARLDKMHLSIKNLILAFKYRKKLKYNKIPNPMKDPSFKKFRNNSEFKSIVKKLLKD